MDIYTAIFASFILSVGFSILFCALAIGMPLMKKIEQLELKK